MVEKAKITGLVYINIGGRRQRSEKDATLEVGGKVGEAVMSANGYEGHATKEIAPAKISATFIHTGNDDVTALQNLRDTPVTFETDSGQTYLIANAGTEGSVKLKGGKIDVEITGTPAELL